MKSHPSPENSKPSKPYNSIILLLLCGCGLIVLLSLLTKRDRSAQPSPASTNAASRSNPADNPNHPAFVHATRHREKRTPEEQVAARLNAFDKNRRDLAQRYAEKLGVALPVELEKFFDAADAGNWEEIDRLYQELEKKAHGGNDGDARTIQKFLQIAVEVFGAHEAAHSWPAHDLLDYGHAVLNSLQPGMVYIGGTDAGRFIPTFLNETSGGEKHIVLTQNAFANGTYLDYANFLYGDRLKTLSGEDSQRAFNDYLTDVQKRYQHDQKFPDEPKQMRLNENFKIQEGSVQVSGQGAVMTINEQMLKMLQQKNPELSFAMEESFSLPSTYSGAIPLGPLMQLGSENSTTKLTTELVANSLDYWRDRISDVTSTPAENPARNNTYAHMIMAQGNLFSSQNFSAEAEQAYRMAQQLTANDPEPTGKLYELLVQTGRASEAAGVLAQFQQVHPEKADDLQKLIRQQR